MLRTMNYQIVFKRCISTTALLLRKHKPITLTTDKQGKLMSKLMSNVERKWFVPAAASRPKKDVSLANFQQPSGGKGDLRRIGVLNALFMQHVSDIIATGEVCPGIVGKGVELTRVNISTDFTRLLVYWMASDKSIAECNIQQMLDECTGHLRGMLSRLQVISYVPYITFIKDKQFAAWQEVETILAKADFGPDFIPTDKNHHYKAGYYTKQDPAAIKNMYSPNTTVCNNVENSSVNTTTDHPDMRQDVLGLDHARLMSRVISAVSPKQVLTKAVPPSQQTQDEWPPNNQEAMRAYNKEMNMSTFLKERKRTSRAAMKKMKENAEAAMIGGLVIENSNEEDVEIRDDDEFYEEEFLKQTTYDDYNDVEFDDINEDVR